MIEFAITIIWGKGGKGGENQKRPYSLLAAAADSLFLSSPPCVPRLIEQIRGYKEGSLETLKEKFTNLTTFVVGKPM